MTISAKTSRQNLSWYSSSRLDTQWPEKQMVPVYVINRIILSPLYLSLVWTWGLFFFAKLFIFFPIQVEKGSKKRSKLLLSEWLSFITPSEIYTYPYPFEETVQVYELLSLFIRATFKNTNFEKNNLHKKVSLCVFFKYLPTTLLL